MLVAKPNDPSLIPRLTKERTDSHKLSSDLHIYTDNKSS